MDSNYKQLDKRVEALERRLQQRVEIRRKKLSGVSYEEMDQKKQSELVQRMKTEYRIF
ncbi:hypothetical protein AALP_AA3G334700 [Arabis alpina]|uniref:Uncharacterized protein n=1 Tax=Arabis alpina TaxID=50452 RepID=A0A087HDC9_ARAAL|nr:hypothetical protein AALP_AA3G334700 [Arabis alpina]